MRSTRLGYSPCPNDTWIFYAWSHAKVAPELPVESILRDVEELNSLALEGRFEFTKASAAAFLKASRDYLALRCGAALGKGVGPLVVARRPLESFAGLRVATPGRLTTAHLLFQLSQNLPELSAQCSCSPVDMVPLRYDQILPAVAQGHVDAGIIIHESRFTYAQMGLQQVFDLGAWWEHETNLPLPLGLILARRDLPREQQTRGQQAIRESLLYSQRNPEEVFPYLRANAIELEDSVIQAHIDLYVNDYSLDVGAVGERAVQELFSRATALGLSSEESEELFLPASPER